MKFHLFLTLECQQSVAMFLFCLQQHDGWGLPQMTAVFFPLFLIHMSSDEKSEISSNSPSTSQYPDVFFLHGGTPVFSMEFSPHYFHFSLHSTVPGHRQSLCWFFRKDVKASGRLCSHRQILGHSGWLLKHQDHNQTQPLIAESKVSSDWLKGHKEMMLPLTMRWRWKTGH